MLFNYMIIILQLVGTKVQGTEPDKILITQTNHTMWSVKFRLIPNTLLFGSKAFKNLMISFMDIVRFNFSFVLSIALPELPYLLIGVFDFASNVTMIQHTTEILSTEARI